MRTPEPGNLSDVRRVSPPSRPLHPVESSRLWYFGMVVLGQSLVSLSGETSPAGQAIAGVALALAGAFVLVRRDYGIPPPSGEWNTGDSPRPRVWGALLALIALMAASWLNFHAVRVGYDADESLELCLTAFPASQAGWLWWRGYDEPLTGNVLAVLWRFLPADYDSVKLAAFLLRTAAGVFVWLLASECFGRRVGLWCGLIVAASVMYVCSFNTVIKETSAPAVFFGCLFFTFRGLRTGSRWACVAGGVFAGLVPYTYATRMAMAGALAFWPLAAWFSAEKDYSLRGKGRLLPWCLVPALLMSAPFLYHLVRYPHAQILGGAAANQNSWFKGGLPLLLSDTWVDLQGIFAVGDHWFTRNYDSQPMLWFPVAVFFWVGLVLILFRWRETRVTIPLVLAVLCLGLAGMNWVNSPNFKLSRPAMLLATIPAALGMEWFSTRLARRFGKEILHWLIPSAVVLASFLHANLLLGQVGLHPASWWFRDPVLPREEFVRSHPDSLLFGIGVHVTNFRSEAPLREITSLREVLETPGDDREVVFLFPDGRQDWHRPLVQFWTSLYPGGRLEQHTVPVEGNRRWPVLITYTLPASAYWWLKPVKPDAPPLERASQYWDRARLLKEHRLPLEAWREALIAARLDPRLDSRVDALMENRGGRRGRLATLLRNGLWEEAREDLRFRGRLGGPSDWEREWLRFLDAHGLETRVYATHTPEEPILAQFRWYAPEMFMGYGAAALRRVHFSMRADGQLDIPETGSYRFRRLTNLGTPQRIMIDGTSVFEFSNRRADFEESAPILLSKGLHELRVENCNEFCFRGPASLPPRVPDPLSGHYQMDNFFALMWARGSGPFQTVPPERLYAPGAREIPVPPWPEAPNPPPSTRPRPAISR